MPSVEPRHELAAGEYRAVVSEVGAALHTLRFQGRDLVRAAETEPPLPGYRGAVLVPWPNRIADGRYSFGGADHQLPVTEVERGCALHGLAAREGWQPVEVAADRLTLGHHIWPQPGYPYALAVLATYVLDPTAGLSISVTARNIGAGTAPYGSSIHPYLVGGPGPVDDWQLRLDAAVVLTVEPARLLPTGQRAVQGSDFDFRTRRTIGAMALDHAFTSLGFAEDGTAAAEITASDGSGARISWDTTCPYVQVHTADSSTGELFRSGLALEPMTCAPDAFNSGAGLLRLDPGSEHATSWRIDAV